MLNLAVLLTLSADLTPPPAAGAAYRQPQLAARGGFLAMTFGSGNQVFFASSANGGESFSEPVLVNSKGVLSLGHHRGPRIAITPKAIVISAVSGEKGMGRDGDILAWRSLDSGKTWSAASRVNDVEGSAREGLHSMAAGPDGALYAAWLDLRAKGTTLYGAASKDNGQTWSPNEIVYKSPETHICECCHPTVEFGADGTPLVMFRNWLAGSRDMYVVNTRTHKASKLGEGTWPLNACPMDGGGLAVSAKGIYAAWRRDGAVYWNELGKKEVELGKGKDPAIALSATGKPVVVWNGPEGLKTANKVLDPKGAFPSLAVAGNDVYAAWESQEKGIRVEKVN